jgi:modulator of FtsH protease HflC
MSKNTIVILLAIIAFVGWDSFFVLQEYEQAIVTRLGQYRASFKHPGIRPKMPFTDTVRRMDKRVLGSDAAPAEYLTLDKKKLVADPISRWRIVDPLKFYKTVVDESGARARLDDIVKSELRDQIASQDFGEIIGNKREALVQKVAAKARTQLSEFGIELLDVRIKRADLPAEVQESVFLRMRAERDRIAKRYRSEGQEEAEKIRAITDRERAVLLAKAYEEAEVIRGEGDAKSIAIYADAYKKDAEFYSFTRSLDAYERVIDSNTNVVLSTDNELLEYFGKKK